MSFVVSTANSLVSVSAYFAQGEHTSMSSLTKSPLNNPYVRLLMIIFSVGVAFGSNFHSSLLKNTQSSNSKEQITVNKISSVTLIDYERLREGMNLTDVRVILGSYGIEQKQVGKNVTVAWQNSDGSNITVIFYNGILQSKSQIGLK
ncbi:hypothetical protein [Nostoc cycadae]|uniref:Transient receptor potential channel C n=1 Tax=Nostoc cycadae WK-1 TaxID=1861711 RepID=A0A2H6LR04_9NOSO|nr:hypothetical protein [Nostoc cycadae]GBE95628.1 transient receptor potential channel C [Nostoc cycadae WK-1]